MKKIYLLLFILVTSIMPVMAQQIQNQADYSQLVEKYKNDTTGFTSYPDVPLLIHISPAKHISKIEINKPYSTNHVYDDTIYRNGHSYRNLHIGPYYIAYKNLYRYPANTNKIPDSIVLSKLDLLKSFSIMDLSVNCWYISAQMKNGRIVSVGDTSALRSFLIKIKNPYDAYLWMEAQFTTEYDHEVPINASPYYKYKKVKGGFLLGCYGPTNTSFATSALKTYFIGEDFQIVIINERHIKHNKNDIIYKI